MKHKTLIICAMAIAALFASCRKSFPDQDILQGTWGESCASCTMKFTFKDGNIACLHRGSSADTFNYSLNRKQDLLELSLLRFPESTSRHRIFYDRKTKELHIFGLLGGIPELPESESIFIKYD